MTGDIPVEFASLASPLACVTWLRFHLGKRAYVESDVSLSTRTTTEFPLLLPRVIYPSSRKIRLIGYGRKTAAYKLQDGNALSIRRSIIDTSGRDSFRKMFFISCLRAPLPNSCKFQAFRKSRLLPRTEYKLMVPRAYREALDATIQSWRLAALFLINLLLGQVKHGEVCRDLCAGN